MREGELDALYRKTAGLARRYVFSFRRPRVTVGGLPVFLFLGNHSSGKSTLINSVLGAEGVQDVGIAPTDDGFTFLIYGEEARDVVGAAALTLLPAEYKVLESFGALFLQHVRVKVRNLPILQKVVLVDSPGMIDASDAARDRDYDFSGVVRRFVELCDMIFFLFDPEKPGTTGETVRIFSECLSDVQYKLRVILNKCDLFANVYDFARAYGTLCWNLSRVLKTKDLPKILTVYSGTPREGANAQLIEEIGAPRHRQELQDLFVGSADRRSDNLFAQATEDFRGLAIRMGVVNAAMRRLRMLKGLYVLFALTVAAEVAYHAGQYDLSTGLKGVLAGVFAAVVLMMAGFVYRPFVSLFRGVLARQVDKLFRRVFRVPLATKVHENLTECWAVQQTETAEIVRSAPLNLPWFAEFRRRRLERALARLLKGETGPYS